MSAGVADGSIRADCAAMGAGVKPAWLHAVCRRVCLAARRLENGAGGYQFLTRSGVPGQRGAIQTLTKHEGIAMSEDKTLTLSPGKYDKLGLVHCGVTREGFIAVGGDVRTIADGEEVSFDRVHVKAKRVGSTYTFTRTS